MEVDDVRQQLASEQERLEQVRADDDTAVLEQVEAELADVERALRRLDDGSYGTCEACSSPIDDDHLAAQPAARYCADHRPS